MTRPKYFARFGWWYGALIISAFVILFSSATYFGRLFFVGETLETAHVHNIDVDTEGFFGGLLKAYTPRRMCMAYETPLIWLHLVSDLLIAAAYFSIPVALIVFVKRRKDLVFNWMFYLFAAFIPACGTTHLFSVWALWQPVYRLDGLVKLLTAAVSVVTAVMLWPLLPKALALPSASELEDRVRERTDELARTNQALRESEERLRTVTQHAQVGLVVVNKDHRYLFANAAYSEILRLPSTELVSRRVAELLPSVYEDQIRPRLERAFNGERVSYELRIPFPEEDRYYAVTYEPRFDASVEPCVVVVIVDMTSLKQVEKVLQESETQLRLVTDALPVLVSYVDREERYRFNNRTYETWFAHDRQEITGRTLQEVLGNAAYEKLKPHVQRALAGELVRFEGEIPYKDGGTRDVEVSYIPDVSTSDGVRGYYAMVMDVTDRKRAQADRENLLEREQTARAAAERASNLKDEFLATLSHELRTPLHSILGWTQVLRLNHAVGDVGEGLTVIERNARVQVQLVEDLLDMSRIVSGKLRIDVQRVDIADIVAAAVESARPAAVAKEIRLQTVLDTQAGAVRGDPSRLQQVVWNLLSNAIKFTPKGGKVQVALERVNSHLEVTVTDTGQGIEPAFLPHVFDRFRQADGTTTRSHGGLGIGLAIVKSIVEAHGGKVRAKSPGLECGATFCIELPVMVVHDDDSAASERQHPKHAPLDGDDAEFVCPNKLLQGVVVLVVDDDQDARELIRRVLEDCSATVVVASSAAEALELMPQSRPNVILSDIGMPIMDGYEFMQRVRELSPDAGGTTPAAALTAFARSDDRRRALIAGYQSHVAKPVEAPELVTIVASLAGRMKWNRLGKERQQDAE
jgi:PAS domain S-box-containing protein